MKALLHAGSRPWMRSKKRTCNGVRPCSTKPTGFTSRPVFTGGLLTRSYHMEFKGFDIILLILPGRMSKIVRRICSHCRQDKSLHDTKMHRRIDQLTPHHMRTSTLLIKDKRENLRMKSPGYMRKETGRIFCAYLTLPGMHGGLTPVACCAPSASAKPDG